MGLDVGIRPLNGVLSSLGGKAFAGESFLSDHMPYLTYITDDVMMLKDGGLMATLRFDGMNAMTASDRDLDNVKRAVSAVISATGSGFGFYVHRLPVSQTVSLTPIEDDSFSAHIDRAWQTHLNEQDLQRRGLYLSVVRRPSFVSGFSLFSKVAAQNFSKDKHVRIQALNEVMNFFEQSLSEAKPKRLTRFGGEWLGYLGALNYGHFRPINEGQVVMSLAAQASYCRATFKDDLVVISDEVTGQQRFGALFSIKTYPSNTHVNLSDAFNFPADTVITNSFTPIRNNIMAERISRTIRQMKAVDDAAVSLREQLGVAADDLESSRITFGNHHLSVAVYTNSHSELEQASAHMRRAVQEMGGVAVREKMALKATYFAQHVGNFSYRPRATPISSVNFADFSALHGDLEGRSGEQSPWGESITAFKTLDGAAYRFNFHLEGHKDKEPTAGHSLVLGTMGTGKTLTSAFLMTQAQRMGARVFFFDKDHGLEMAIRAMGGKYNTIRAGLPTGLNPLATETDERGRAWLSDWLNTLLARKGELTGEQAKQLQAAILQNAYADKPLQNFQSFEQLFQSLDDDGELQNRIAEWNEGGRFGWVFDQNTSDKALEFDGDLVGFDMTEILDMETERTAVLSYIFRQIERVVEDKKPTIILLDEAWKYLDDAYFVKRLNNWAVTLRKLNVVLVMLTQLPSQLESSKIGKTIVETASTQMFFPNSKAEPNDYEIFNLNDKETASLVTTHHNQRFALVKSDHDSVLLNVDLSPLGPLLPILGGGATGEKAVGSNWRENPNFWRKNL